MNVYVFSSINLTNIWAGVGARMWAVSEAQAANPANVGKARNHLVGAFGLLYCSAEGVQSFTIPFVIRSSPDLNVTVEGVWPEPWRLPFRLIPFGTPRKLISKDSLRNLLPGLLASGKRWNDYLLISPTTVFAPSKIEEGDWDILIRELADD